MQRAFLMIVVGTNCQQYLLCCWELSTDLMRPDYLDNTKKKTLINYMALNFK